jgi:hypothetical protein
MLVESKNKEKLHDKANEVPKETTVEKKEVLSITEIMKDTTTGIVNKMSSQLPLHMQLYSQLFQEYLRLMDSLFCEYIMSRKPLFNQIDSGEESLKSFKEFSNAVGEIYRSQIESTTKFLQISIPVRIEILRIYDKCMQILIQAYGNAISQSFPNVEKKP